MERTGVLDSEEVPMGVHGIKKGLKRAGRLARKGGRKARPLLCATAPIAITFAAEALPGAPAVRLLKGVLNAIK